MLQENIKQSWLVAELARYRPRLGHINYFSITNYEGWVYLTIHQEVVHENEGPLIILNEQRFVRKLFRQVMDLVDMKVLTTHYYGEGTVNYVLVDPNQATVKVYRKKNWESPRSDAHPHQIWLSADIDAQKDRKVKRRAFQAVCGYLKAFELRTLYGLHDSAQYHFIMRMMFIRSDGSYDHPDEALNSAIKHHKEVMKM